MVITVLSAWFNDFRISIVQNQIAYLIDAEAKATARGDMERAVGYGNLKEQKEKILNKLLGLNDDETG
jgi:hypothetical protein